MASSSSAKKDLRRRAETPTRELLRRVQKRSSAGMAMAPPPPMPPLPAFDQLLQQPKTNLRSPTQSARHLPTSIYSQRASRSERSSSEEVEELTSQVDSIRGELESRDELIQQLESQLAAEASRSKDASASSSNGGLTRVAAYKLEREFASQERILQGLQRDNEAKTVEVERLRREKKIMADHFARHYGAEDWETIVFGPSYSPNALIPIVGGVEKRTTVSQNSPFPTRKSAGYSSSSPAQPLKGSAARLAGLAKPHEMPSNDASFYSADESFATAAAAAAAGPPPQTTLTSSPSSARHVPMDVDLCTILAMIESQKLVIKGFEASNTLKLIECREQFDLARKRERLLDTQLEVTMERQKIP